MKNKKIAITIQNMVQFYSIKPGIDKLIEQNHIVDIYIPIYKTDQLGFCNMYDEAYNNIKKYEKYNIKREYSGEKYKVVLTPYDMGIFYKFDADYNIKYKYAVSAKPKLTLKPEENIIYDGILCYSTWESEMLNVYAPTYNIGNTKFYDFKPKKNNSKKPILLYLPTYGNYSSIDLIIEKLKELKEKYKIITKIHHGTTHLKNEKSKRNRLEDICDEVYDENYELTRLLEIANVVISDNSGSIFESLCAKVPVAVFSDDADLSLGDLQPLQKRLINEKVIPFTSNIKNLDSIITKALDKKTIKKQNEVSKKLFTVKQEELVNKFTDVINMYLNDEINLDYYYLHKELVKYINNLNESERKWQKYENNVDAEKEELKDKIYNVETELSDYRNGKLYKISTKIYKIINSIKKR